MSKGTRQVRYVGLHDAVELIRPDGSVVAAVRGGDPVSVPAEFAEELLSTTTDSWEVVPDAPPAKQKGE